MDTYTVNVKLSFTGHNADEVRNAAITMLFDLANEHDEPTREAWAAPEFLSWFVADAVESGIEV